MSEHYISEWKPCSNLINIKNDISEYGYNKEFLDANKEYRKKNFHCSNAEGQVNYFEFLEVKLMNDDVYYRVNEECSYKESPESFATQFGIFNNHDNGEFTSWVERDDKERLSGEEKEIRRIYEGTDFYIDGNFCDMFDCGEYTYAISNQLHMGLGFFKIVRIDSNLNYTDLYNNNHDYNRIALIYAGRIENEKGYMLITSGYYRAKKNKKGFQYKTLIFQIDREGNCEIYKEWDINIAYSINLVNIGNYVYFGQNKMITRLDMNTGRLEYFTNKTNEELAALGEMW